MYICNLNVRKNVWNEKTASKENKFRHAESNLTFQTKFNNEISTSSSLLPTTPKKKGVQYLYKEKSEIYSPHFNNGKFLNQNNQMEILQQERK